MAYVVTEPCIKCKYTDCVAVCPVDAFREGVNFLVIDPETCIDCDLCVPECPVNAICADSDVPENWSQYIELNERLAAGWPVIAETKDPLPSAEEFKEVEDKSSELDESPGA